MDIYTCTYVRAGSVRESPKPVNDLTKKSKGSRAPTIPAFPLSSLDIYKNFSFFLFCKICRND